MTSPLEQAARAAASAEKRYVSQDGDSWDVVPMMEKARYQAIVRAVILAIREPSEGMELALDNLQPRDGWWPDEPGERNSPKQVWQAMLDALLSEQP